MIKHVELINKEHKILRGYLDCPEGATTLVVMFHGYTGNKTEHNGYFRTLSRNLSAIGIASLRMDYSCNGESDGEFVEFSYLEAIADAKLMIDFGASVPGINHLAILGYSMGGAIAALVCDYRPIDALLLWSPAGSLYEKLKERFDASPKTTAGTVYSAAFELSSRLVDSMAGIDPYQACKSFTKPVLVIHGRNDKTVPHLTGLTYAVKFPNSRCHIVDGAGHGYDEETSKNDLFTKTLAFFKEVFCKSK